MFKMISTQSKINVFLKKTDCYYIIFYLQAALYAIQDLFVEKNTEVPVFVSNTIKQNY